jgi:hypothetical protein
VKAGGKLGSFFDPEDGGESSSETSILHDTKTSGQSEE